MRTVGGTVAGKHTDTKVQSICYFALIFSFLFYFTFFLWDGNRQGYLDAAQLVHNTREDTVIEIVISALNFHHVNCQIALLLLFFNS